MKEKNYNLELVRIVSFLLVIAIHVSNYFCRAYGEISRGEYLFSIVVDTAARVSVPSFFMISGALLLGRDEPLGKHGKRLLRFVTALVVWSAVYYLWNTFYMGTPYDLREILYVPTEAHLWYLYAGYVQAYGPEAGEGIPHCHNGSGPSQLRTVADGRRGVL